MRRIDRTVLQDMPGVQVRDDNRSPALKARRYQVGLLYSRTASISVSWVRSGSPGAMAVRRPRSFALIADTPQAPER